MQKKKSGMELWSSDTMSKDKTQITGYTVDIWNTSEDIWFVHNKPRAIEYKNGERVNLWARVSMSSTGTYRTKRKAFRVAVGIMDRYPKAVVEVNQWVMRKVNGVKRRMVRGYYFSDLSRYEFDAFFEKVAQNRAKIKEAINDAADRCGFEIRIKEKCGNEISTEDGWSGVV